MASTFCALQRREAFLIGWTAPESCVTLESSSVLASPDFGFFMRLRDSQPSVRGEHKERAREKSLSDKNGEPGEDNKVGLVGLQPLDVRLQRLLTAVLAAMVHGDADRLGLLGTETGSLELVQCEATAETNLSTSIWFCSLQRHWRAYSTRDEKKSRTCTATG